MSGTVPVGLVTLHTFQQSYKSRFIKSTSQMQSLRLLTLDNLPKIVIGPGPDSLTEFI